MNGGTHQVILLGSGFSPGFADVILLTDAVILALVLLAAFSDDLVEAWKKALQRTSSAAVFLLGHLRLRQK